MSAEEVNIYRDSFLRYFGYAHHVGTHVSGSLHYVFSGITASYIFADLMDKVKVASTATKEVPKKTKPKDSTKVEDDRRRIVTESCDVILWQGLASLIIPGFIARSVNRIVVKELSKKCSWREYSKPVSSTLALAAIFLASHPVDSLTTELLNSTFKLFKDLK